VLRRVCRERPDVLHLHTPNPTMLLALAALRPAIPLVITHHSDVIRQRWLWYAVAPFERQVYNRAAVILSDSPTYAAGSAVLRRYAAKVRDLPLGIALEPYLQPNTAALEHARKLRDQHGAPLWLAVGRLIYYKGLDVALRALTRVAGKLLVIGTGPLSATLRQLAQELGVADRVIWQGHASADELTGAYHAATALWFPSNARSEGFGLVQVEAMASGCPVINTAIPNSGVAWVSPHEETGLTVPMNDPEALANAANRLLSQPGLRSRLAQNARQRAEEQFDQRTMGNRNLVFYRAIARASAATSPWSVGAQPALSSEA
jgi:rhamnosyl/mannosyltransferase